MQLLKTAICYCGLFAVCAQARADWNPATDAKRNVDDFRNFYGIAWRGTADENLDYARQMGYKYIFFKWDMERNPKAKGFKFFVESPEYGVYPRNIDLNKKYTPEQIKWWETNCSLTSLDKPFPQNIAAGWREGTRFTATLDLQQKRVIREITDKIVKRVQDIEKNTPDFKFAGFAWDVPQPEGDFWAGTKDNWLANGAQVTLSYWTGKDSGAKHPDVVHDYPTYSQGHMEFYRYLFEQARAKISPDAKFIVEPSDPYTQWVAHFERPPFDTMPPAERKKYEADLVAVEAASTNFVQDKRLFAKQTVKKSQMCSTTPNAYEEPVSRLIAGLAAKNGAWTAFFGMPEGNGHTAGFNSIAQMPARLKLVKAIPVWENLLGVPRKERKWDDATKTYTSPTAQISADAYSGLQPDTDKLFFVFLSMDGKVKIPQGYEAGKIYLTDGLFREIRELCPDPKTSYQTTLQDGRTIEVKDGEISPKASYIINTGYIMHLRKK